MASRGVLRPSQITDAALDHWRTSRMALRSRATVNRDEVVARALLAWCAERGLCGITPLARRRLLREPRRSDAPEIPSPETVRRVLVELHAMAAEIERSVVRTEAGEERRSRRADTTRGIALALETALLTGLRLDELRHLSPEHVFSHAVRVLPESGPALEAWATKSYRDRSIPLGPESLARVRAFAAWRVRAIGSSRRPAALTQSWIARRVRAAAKRAGVPAFDPHDLRRTFATEAVRRGIPVTVVRGWLGHRDVSTTERYLGRYAEDASLVAAP